MSAVQFSHDPQKVLSDLRDHLARHDKPIAFFFGAGTSCAVRVPSTDKGNQTEPLVPAVAGLTERAKQDASILGEDFCRAWGLIETQCQEAKQTANVENILSRLRMMLSAVGQGDSLAGLDGKGIMKLEESVRKSIASLVIPDLNRVSIDIPQRRFARWIARTSRKHPVEVFTVNYDVLIEHGLEAEQVPFFDGFVGGYRPFFFPDSLRALESAPGANWTRLWKMHGSVTWRRVEHCGTTRVIRGEPDLNGEMIYPSFQKYAESREQPYAAFADRLRRFLGQEDALLVVAGFSFADEHINELIFGNFGNRSRTHVYALQFSEPETDCDLCRRAILRPNIIVVGPHTGIVGSRRGRWEPAESPVFTSDVFDLHEESSPSGEINKVGIMRIVDFARFCDFLETMTPE